MRLAALSQSEPIGTASRRAAMRLLDAVLRKGLPLEAALDVAARDLERADDRAFAHGIAAETLRRITDLDALIDSATKKPLPDDSKARFALRSLSVQALAMENASPCGNLDRASSGRWRTQAAGHGVFSAVIRSGAELPEIPSLPPAVEERWEQAWGTASRGLLLRQWPYSRRST
jgi:16S rRNA (cytosine967-C5)-methyltransferase